MTDESERVDECNELKMPETDVPQEVPQEPESKVAETPERPLDADGINQLLGTLVAGIGQLRNDMYKHYSNMRYLGFPFNEKQEIMEALKKSIADSTNVEEELQNLQSFEKAGTASKEDPSDAPAANDDKKI